MAAGIVKELDSSNRSYYKADDIVKLLDQIFQRTGITPDEVYSKTPGVRAFMFASMMVRLEDDEKGGAANGG